MKKLIIIGAGGHGRETAWVAQAAGFEVVGFLDDDTSKHKKVIAKFLCHGSVRDVVQFQGCYFTIAIGNSRARKHICKELKRLATVNFATIIHPSVLLLNPYNFIGEGSVIFPGAVITESVKIGSHVIVNVRASVSHDSVIGDFATLNPASAICGNCHIERGVEIGAGATVIQNIKINEGAFIGAGAVVTKQIDANALVVGVPAKKIKTLNAF